MPKYLSLRFTAKANGDSVKENSRAASAALTEADVSGRGKTLSGTW